MEMVRVATEKDSGRLVFSVSAQLPAVPHATPSPASSLSSPPWQAALMKTIRTPGTVCGKTGGTLHYPARP